MILCNNRKELIAGPVYLRQDISSIPHTMELHHRPKTQLYRGFSNISLSVKNLIAIVTSTDTYRNFNVKMQIPLVFE